MRSTWLKRPLSGAIFVSSLIGLSYFLEPAAAWQFRDLDPTEDNALEVSPSDTVDLIRTNEEFIAPIIDASEFNKKSEKVEREKTDGLPNRAHRGRGEPGPAFRGPFGAEAASGR